MTLTKAHYIVDMLKNREVDLVLNTPLGKLERQDDNSIRSAAILAGIPCITTRAGISAMVSALAALHRGEYTVTKLQEHHSKLPKREGAKASSSS